MNISNYLKIKNSIPSTVNLLAVSKGFKSKEIKIINNLGQKDFGESKFQEGFQKQVILKDLKDIKWHFIGRIQSNKIRKIVQNFKYIHSVDTYEKLEKISSVSFEEMKHPSIMLQVKLSDDPNKGGFEPKLLIALRFIPLVQEEFQNLIKSVSVRSINFRQLGLKKSINVLITLVERLFLNIFLRIEQGADALLSKKKILIQTNRFRTDQKTTALTFIINTLSICFIFIAIFLRKLYGAL